MRKLCLLLGVPLLLLALSGCGEPTAATASRTTVTATTVVLDVRTAPEYAAGHLKGARLLDLNSGEFAAALPQLATDVDYVVYCRSGNRSAQASKLMKEAGFADVTDLGSLEDAADATGVTIVS